jgi:hypothetical protein
VSIYNKELDDVITVVEKSQIQGESPGPWRADGVVPFGMRRADKGGRRNVSVQDSRRG